MRCQRIPGGVLCMPDVPEAEVRVGGRPVRFTFDRRSGPLVLTRDGRTSKRQPADDDRAFWRAFNRWLTRHPELAGGRRRGPR